MCRCGDLFCSFVQFRNDGEQRAVEAAHQEPVDGGDTEQSNEDADGRLFQCVLECGSGNDSPWDQDVDRPVGLALAEVDGR